MNLDKFVIQNSRDLTFVEGGSRYWCLKTSLDLTKARFFSKAAHAKSSIRQHQLELQESLRVVKIKIINFEVEVVKC